MHKHTIRQLNHNLHALYGLKCARYLIASWLLISSLVECSTRVFPLHDGRMNA